MDGALTKLADGGPYGVLLVIAILALAYMGKALMAAYALAREDRGEAVKALTENANAMRELAKTIEQNTNVLQRVAVGVSK